MLLTLFCLLVALLTLRSCILLIWRNKKEKKFFAPIHFIIIVLTGFFSFCILFLIALGSSGHYVESDFDEFLTDVTLGISLAGTLLGIIGFFIALVVWIKNLLYRKGIKNR